MKNKILNILMLSLTTFLTSAVASACPYDDAEALAKSVIKTDAELALIDYGVQIKDSKVSILDMERDNIYVVKNPEAQVFSAHGTYFSGYFIFVLEVEQDSCRLLEKTLIYEE